MSKFISPNSREAIGAYDPILEEFFYIEGTAANGAINVNATVNFSGTIDSNITEIGGSAITLGQKTMANSFPVAIASDQSAIPVSQSGSWTVTANAGTNLNTSALALESTLSAINAKLVSGTDIGDVTVNNGAGAAAVNIQDGGNSITVDYATTGSGTATGALRVELPTNGTGVIATVGTVTSITNPVTVQATNLDIRDLNSGTDSVSAVQSGTWNVGVTTQAGVANIATGQQALTTSAAQVVAPRATRRSVTIVNLSSIDVYIGNTGVTDTTGQLLLGTKGTALTLETTTAVYAVAATGTPSVSYLEEYA